MKSAWLTGSWLVIAGCVVVACGGADATELFSTSGVSSGTSGSSGTSSGDAGTSGTSGASGTSGTSGTTTDAGTSGTSGSSGDPTTCRPAVAGDCNANEYCKVSACAATGGTCTVVPPALDAAAPVCGCDNLTYYNESLSAAAKVNVSASGACPTASAITCKTSTPTDAAVDCPDGSFCDLQVPACQFTIDAIPGVCWVLPKQCASTETASYRTCSGVGNPNGNCKGLCEMIRAEKDFAADADNCK